MDPFSSTTGVTGLVALALRLVTDALGMTDKTVAAHNKAADELKQLQGDLEDLQAQMSKIHATLQGLASNTKDHAFKKLLRDEHGNTAIARLCTALDETFVLLEQLTDQTKAQESQLHSLSLPNNTKSLQFVQEVLKHNLAPSKTTDLLQTLRYMRSEIQMCLEKLDAAFQHSWELYTLLSNRLARVDTMESTSTTLTARIKLVDWLKKREGILGISRQTNNATMSNDGEQLELQVGLYVNEDAGNTVGPAKNLRKEVTWFEKKSVAHIGSRHQRRAISALRLCHELENLDLPAETPPDVKESIMIQVQKIVQTTYHAVQVAADPTKTVEVVEQELANITPQVDQYMTENARHISIDSVKHLRAEVTVFENAKKQDQEAVQEARKLANRLLNAVPKLEKVRKEHNFYIHGRSKRSTQHMIFHLQESAKLPEIVWRFQRKYQQWFPNSCVPNPHFYPEITSLHLDRGVIRPLSDYNERWTRAITVIGDDLNSRFKLADSNSLFMYEPVKNLTNSDDTYFFKDTKARLYPPRMLDFDIRRRADGLGYYFWEEADNSFIKADTVRTMGELVQALNIPEETKDEIRRKARERPRPSSVKMTTSPRTAHTASNPSTIPSNTYSLTSIEVSTDSPGTSNEYVLDFPSWTTTVASELISTSKVPSSPPLVPVQGSVDGATYRNNISRGTIQILEPTRNPPKHRIHPTTLSVAPLTTTVSVGKSPSQSTKTPERPPFSIQWTEVQPKTAALDLLPSGTSLSMSLERSPQVTPVLVRPLARFLSSSYVQAGDILRTSRRVEWFSLQALHISRQAFHLIIHFNESVALDRPTKEQLDEGLELDDALDELEDKIDELVTLSLDDAHNDEEDHVYDLNRLYQIFFTRRAFFPDERDYRTNRALQQLAGTDHAQIMRALQWRELNTNQWEAGVGIGDHEKGREIE